MSAAAASNDRDARLVAGWSAYADGLAALGPADRFLAEVLVPFRSGIREQQVRAVAFWPEWRPAALQLAGASTPADFARLADGLADLLRKVEARSSPARWFGKEPVDPFAAPETKTLLTECREAFAGLAKPAPIATAKLSDLATEIDGLLATAPLDWPPAASLHAAELLRRTADDPAGPALAIEAIALCRDPASGDPLRIASAFLDGFPKGATADLDRLLAAVRGWASGFGIGIQPTGWSFTAMPSLEAVQAEGVEISPVYRPDTPLGTVVRVKSFGLTRDLVPIRPAIVTVSAGPAPPGLGDLEALLTTPTDVPIRQRLKDWRSASLGGTLESAAIELFVDFWDRFRSVLAASDPSHAATVGDRLADTLAAAFHLTPIYPANFQDHPPGWVTIADGGRMTTGRVREVLRPGLVDASGSLRVPARVTVE